MLHLDLNGTPLLLPEKTTATVEHRNPLIAEGLQESSSLPLEIPVHGNEVVLGHVHELAQRTRRLLLDGAHLGDHGLPMFPGQLRVLSTIPESVRSYFFIQGFLNRIKGITLPQALAGLDIEREIDEEVPGYDLTHRPNYADGGDCRFPMYLNPSMYGEANPDFYPDASEWSSGNTYGVGDLVRFKVTEVIEREYIYQCISATTTGQSPANTVGKWRRAAFGLVNAWNNDLEDLYFNSGDGNYYTWVPWFYIKWVLTKALAFIGYRPIGDFMNDVRTHEELLPNNTTIDKLLQPESGYFFRAHLTDPVYYDGDVSWEEFVMPAQADTPAPYVDLDDVWDPANGQWECPAAGVFQFRIALTLSNAGAPSRRYIRVWIRRASDLTPFGSTVVMVPRLGPFGGTFNITAAFDLADIGEKFFFNVEAFYNAGGVPVRIWPTATSHGFLAVEIRGWRAVESPGIVIPDSIIYPSRHVPDVTLGDFIEAIAGAFNCEIVPNDRQKTVRFDYREPIATNPERYTTEQSHRWMGHPEIDHQRAILGLKYAWDLEDNEPDTDYDQVVQQEFFSETDLTPPIGLGETALVLSTRKKLKSVFGNGEYYWRHVGYYIPPVLVGEQEEARTIIPECQPLHMEQITLDGRAFIVPILDELGTSGWFHNKGKNDTIYLCEFAEAMSSDEEVGPIPGARSWQYGWTYLDLSAMSHVWDREGDGIEGLFQQLFEKWANLLVNAEPVTMSLLSDPSFITSPEWRRVMHIHGQRYIAELLPVIYGAEGPQVAKDSYLYRLRTPGIVGTPTTNYTTCPVGYEVFNEIILIGVGGVRVQPLVTPEAGTSLGTARYRINGGAWVTMELEAGANYSISANPTDVVDIEVLNGLRLDCPPWAASYTVAG